MFLHQLNKYQPSKNAFNVNSQCLAFDMHPSCDFLAFSTRSNQVILRNIRTGRTIVVHHSKHGIQHMQFTNDYLLVVEKTVHEIYVFSLKNQKIKKKLTGHRTQISKMAYCRQRNIFASISHDVCLIWNQSTLVKQKTLNCQTSTFSDILFTENGEMMITAFKDSSIFVWDLEEFTFQDVAVENRNVQIATNKNSVLAVYNKKSILLSNITQRPLIFENIQPFWQGSIKKVGFIEQAMIVLTTQALYLVDLHLDHRFVLKSVREVKQEVNSFAISSYNSLLLLLTDKFRYFELMEIQNQKIVQTEYIVNPLTNQGLTCAGGLSSQMGCFVSSDMPVSNQYAQVGHRVENICSSNYESSSNAFSPQKLRDFIAKNHAFPDKHRPTVYRSILKLPVNPRQFRMLQQKGRHECTELIDSKYPLNNKKLSEIIKDVVSLLANYHPIFAEAEEVCTVIFPFVCLFGNDTFLCFQILYRLFSGPLCFLFEEFPVANSKYIQNMQQILKFTSPQLLNHFNTKKISFTKVAWSLLSSLFTKNVPRQTFLAMVDNILTRYHEPQYVMFLCLSYLIFNKSRIFTINNQKDMDSFLEEEHTVHTGKILSLAQSLLDKYRKKIHYQFSPVGWNSETYQPLANIPKDAIKMYEGRRKLAVQELRKAKEEQFYKDRMIQQMEKLTTKARRDAQRQLIEKESYDLLKENQQKNRIVVQTSKGKEQRIQKLEELIDQLRCTLQNQKHKTSEVKNFMPAFTNLEHQSSQELDQIQLKLMKMLTDLKPNSFSHPMKSQPFALHKTNPTQHNAFKSSLYADMANKMWQIDSLDKYNQQKYWQTNMLKTMKAGQ